MTEIRVKQCSLTVLLISQSFSNRFSCFWARFKRGGLENPYPYPYPCLPACLTRAGPITRDNLYIHLLTILSHSALPLFRVFRISAPSAFRFPAPSAFLLSCIFPPPSVFRSSVPTSPDSNLTSCRRSCSLLHVVMSNNLVEEKRTYHRFLILRLSDFNFVPCMP